MIGKGEDCFNKVLFLKVFLSFEYFACFYVCGPIDTGVTGDGELPCGCWELNLGPLEEQPMLEPLSHLSISQITIFMVMINVLSSQCALNSASELCF